MKLMTHKNLNISFELNTLTTHTCRLLIKILRLMAIVMIWEGCEEQNLNTNTIEQDQGVITLGQANEDRSIADLMIINDLNFIQPNDYALNDMNFIPSDMWQDLSINEEDQATLSNDQDQDGIVDSQDNCPTVFNPRQDDFDQNGIGDKCEPDRDQDGIPDEWDPAPNDASWPGRTLPDTVYAHTSDALYSLDIKSTRPTLIAPFTFEAEEAFITDIAINRAGVLWAISFQNVYICHAQEAYCKPQGYLPNERLNGLTFISGSVYNQDKDVLVGIDQFGTWYALSNEGFGNTFMAEEVGRYPLGDRSSGDVFSIEDVGTFASIKRAGESSDLIMTLDPQRVFLGDDLLFLDGYQAIYGLAGWRGLLFAFDESGAILRVNTQDLSFDLLSNEGLAWWGAGVSSVIYSLEE